VSLFTGWSVVFLSSSHQFKKCIWLWWWCSKLPVFVFTINRQLQFTVSFSPFEIHATAYSRSLLWFEWVEKSGLLSSFLPSLSSLRRRVRSVHSWWVPGCSLLLLLSKRSSLPAFLVPGWWSWWTEGTEKEGRIVSMVLVVKRRKLLNIRPCHICGVDGK